MLIMKINNSRHGSNCNSYNNWCRTRRWRWHDLNEQRWLAQQWPAWQWCSSCTSVRDDEFGRLHSIISITAVLIRLTWHTAVATKHINCICHNKSLITQLAMSLSLMLEIRLHRPTATAAACHWPLAATTKQYIMWRSQPSHCKQTA